MTMHLDHNTSSFRTLQAHTEECHRKLMAKGISSRVYHAGIASQTRSEVQDWFMASTDGIVVCTIAFGMGIDKADLRQVSGSPASCESELTRTPGRASVHAKDAREL
jgi:superfamily II DNA helicase RecQ